MIHFETSWSSGFNNDVGKRLIGNTAPSDSTKRKNFWIDTFETLYVRELNNSNSYHEWMLLHFYKTLTHFQKVFVFVLLRVSYSVIYIFVTVFIIPMLQLKIPDVFIVRLRIMESYHSSRNWYPKKWLFYCFHC